MPTIRIDDEVYAWLQTKAMAFEDTPNSVLRRVAGMDKSEEKVSAKRQVDQVAGTGKNGKTPQWAYREPILRALKRLGGEASRMQVLKEIESAMSHLLTKADKTDISSGTVRWQKSAEWEVRVMREKELLRPVAETARGMWALSAKGKSAARDL